MREAGITKARLSSASAVGRRTFYLKNHFPAREFEKSGSLLQNGYRFLVLLLFPGVQQLIVSSLQLTDQTSVGRRDFIGRTILHQIHDLIFQKFLFSFVCRSQTCVGVEGKQDFIVNGIGLDNINDRLQIFSHSNDRLVLRSREGKYTSMFILQTL